MIAVRAYRLFAFIEAGRKAVRACQISRLWVALFRCAGPGHRTRPTEVLARRWHLAGLFRTWRPRGIAAGTPDFGQARAVQPSAAVTPWPGLAGGRMMPTGHGA